MSKASSVLLAQIYGFTLCGSVGYATKIPLPRKKIKQCLYCGRMHVQNNSFCSADCCSAYKTWHQAD